MPGEKETFYVKSNIKTVVDFNKAQDYLELCNKASDAYAHKINSVKSKTTDEQYKVVCTSETASSNFKAVLFKRGDEYIVSFFGTDIKSLKDIGTDVVMCVDRNPKQFSEAEKFVAYIIREYNIPLYKLIAIGNSEGGSEAIHVMGIFGLKEVYTFNGYVHRMTQYDQRNLVNIYNFRTSNDLVSKGGHVVGEDYIVPLSDNCKPKWGIFGVKDWHEIANMGDCRKAIPSLVYEILNPDWKNKYMFGILTTKEIEDIPNGIYHLFEDSINNRIRNNAIIDSNRPRGDFYTNSSFLYSNGGITHQNCAGTYQVSGYTREDGTQVPSYFRTCGAKHLT